MRRFYRDWYRPDLQGLIVVGEVNIDSIEIHIRNFFWKLVNPDVRRDRTEFDVSLDGSNDIIRVTDVEMPYTEITFYMKRESHPCVRYGDLKNSVIHKLYDQMARLRFEQVGRGYNLPFRNANHFISEQELPGVDVLKTRFEVDSGRVENGMKAILTEVFRVKRLGFTDGEWKRVRESIGWDYLAGYDSRVSADRFTDQFLKRQAAPDPDYEKFLVKEILSQLTLEDVNRFGKGVDRRCEFRYRYSLS